MSLIKIIPIKSTSNVMKIPQIIQFRTKKTRASGLDTVPMSFVAYAGSHAHQNKDAPPLIIMHGLFGSKRNWHSLSQMLHKKTVPQRKVLTVDARNHGDSPHRSAHSYPLLAEDIMSFLDEQRIRKAALLGHSMGGRAMMYFALKYPKLVEKVIIIDISPVSSSPTLTSMPYLFSAVQEVELPRDVSLMAARKECDSQLSKNVKDKDLRSFLLANLTQQKDGSYFWRINFEALSANFADNIAVFPQVGESKFEGPVLFVTGAKSDFVKASDHSAILKIFPKSEFHEIPGAGHWLHSEKPTDFLQIALEFLNRKRERS